MERCSVQQFVTPEYETFIHCLFFANDASVLIIQLRPSNTQFNLSANVGEWGEGRICLVYQSVISEYQTVGFSLQIIPPCCCPIKTVGYACPSEVMILTDRARRISLSLAVSFWFRPRKTATDRKMKIRRRFGCPVFERGRYYEP